MCETVEECCCHLCVAEDLSPFTEAEIGRDDDTGALIEFAEKVEQMHDLSCKVYIADRRRGTTYLKHLSAHKFSSKCTISLHAELQDYIKAVLPQLQQAEPDFPQAEPEYM